MTSACHLQTTVTEQLLWMLCMQQLGTCLHCQLQSSVLWLPAVAPDVLHQHYPS